MKMEYGKFKAITGIYGAILFGTYFSTGKDRPVDVITNHATYYIAQFIIATSIFFIR